MKHSLFFAAALLTATAAFGAGGFGGSVRDTFGAAVAGAEVQIRNAGGTVLFTTNTDAAGRFIWPDGRRGYFQVRVAEEGFATREMAVLVQGDSQAEITLEPESVYTRLTVNATRGAVEEAEASPQLVIGKDRADIRKRPVATIGNVLEHEPGVLVQQSTYAQVSPFLRGLTGYHVLNLVDGIRFNNSTFRSGPNQYLAFVEPTQVQRLEALLGPAGVQYGSDSLGGTINVATFQPRFAARKSWEAHGDLMLAGAAADLSGIGSGRLSISNERVFWLIGVSGRRHNDLRAGRGHDSRNVFHRLFGMPMDGVQELVGSRQQDSGFRQYGAETKFALRLKPYQILTFNYQRGVQDMVRGYKDMLGGLGRLQSAFDPQVLDWFYVRHEKLGLGPFDSVTGTFSLNSQSDGSVRQNLSFTDPITRDLASVKVYGYTAHAMTHWTTRLFASFGGDVYDERISAERTVGNPATGTAARPRPLYPDNSKYQNLGVFAQASYDLASSLRATAGVRGTGVRFATQQDRVFEIPQSSQWFSDVTYHTSVSWRITNVLGLHGVASRGFRAPNLNDLGALGLNDLGYEIPAADAIPAGALLSTDSGEGALSKNERLHMLRPESLMNYEAGVRLTTRRAYARVQLFNAELHNPIVRRTLLFPVSNAPAQLAGFQLTPTAQTAAQRAQGVVAVATQLDPRGVKAFVNDGRARYYGLEALARFPIARSLSFEANYSYLAGRELDPNRNIRRLPPQTGAATLRYNPSGPRPWFEVSVAAAGAQNRLSGGDRDDERIGASFRRSDIAAFFQGSRVAPWLDSGKGVFRPTGETLLQIQDRVLPIGSVIHGTRVVDNDSRVPLYVSTAGWAAVSLRSGIPLSERWQAAAALENVLDRNYRFHGSGVDAPGINAYLSLTYRF
ncbi:MAG: TonB-dependent receptor [Bryobacteraceae bacterium]